MILYKVNMLLYKNGRIYEFTKMTGETRYQYLMRCWFTVNASSSEAEAIAWSSKMLKKCFYESIDETLIEMTTKLTK